ncbi:DOPA 4,5-dioxygenase family protein [Limobrevibacterium gyesilva]|uniref:DOPA 4,5-dioxygenase family protein n=1 Tax=Limobrevibacterium gyesilva TaxID=2991712 RepID=A0AA42CJI8_9PROT|nr:DOPA 4,5-dioxygenase family protein [Limobrevibacterium gyesilva]MCW3476942.1 DOPA 4,5-dioxygenase family protein [Limobrevibacterium gyesilva]
MDAPADPATIDGWHAHVYYTPATRDRAAQLRDWIGARFPVTLGRWHEGKVGPHPQAMYQVAFPNAVFADLVAFLSLNRMGLTILVHPNTKRERDDHLIHALWLGGILPLDASVLREQKDD